MLWRSLYLRYYEDQTPQHEAWNEYIIIKEKEFQLRSYVNKLRQYVNKFFFSNNVIKYYFRELLELERKCMEKNCHTINLNKIDKDSETIM